jgi:hypothetical protein
VKVDGVPEATMLKLALLPATTVWLTGWVATVVEETGRCTSTVKCSKIFFPPASTALRVKKCTPSGRLLTCTELPTMVQLVDAGMTVTVGAGPSASLAAKLIAALPSVDVT